jgi:hypothetical protein
MEQQIAERAEFFALPGLPSSRFEVLSSKLSAEWLWSGRPGPQLKSQNVKPKT